jgi:mannonate dehydratase
MAKPGQLKRFCKQAIEQAGLRWSVVESVPVHEDIKQQTGNWQNYILNYQQTLKNLATCNITTVCYNFMPVLDWTRTDLAYQVEDGSKALRFDKIAIAAFDIHLLQRPNAVQDYDNETIIRAKYYFETQTPEALHQLQANVLAGLPGAEETYGLEDFQKKLTSYSQIDDKRLRKHLINFIQAIAPVAQEVGTRLAIHPDDPPFPIFGLPRVVSTSVDVEDIYNAYHNEVNGLCFCTGSFGARLDNNLPEMFRQLGHRVNFLHLRSVQLESNGSFYEANHLEGSHDMYAIMLEIVKKQSQRNIAIPMRPDHGHQMLDDLQKKTNPGYSAIGRLRGLAELRGLEMGIRRSLENYKI